jgi:hypothetical protein
MSTDCCWIDETWVPYQPMRGELLLLVYAWVARLLDELSDRPYRRQEVIDHARQRLYYLAQCLGEQVADIVADEMTRRWGELDVDGQLSVVEVEDRVRQKTQHEKGLDPIQRFYPHERDLPLN